MIILFLVSSLFHVSNTQQDQYSFIESTSCGQLRATDEQLSGAEPLFPSVERIYNGKEVTFTSDWYPWTVEFRTSYTRTVAGKAERRKGVCTGSIINSQWVVSAAHCFFFIEPNPDTGINRNVRIPLSGIEVNVGMFGRQKTTINEPMFTASPVQVIQHQQYLGDGDVRRHHFDIALVKLDHELEFTVITSNLAIYSNRFYINSICLPRNDPDITGKLHTSAGFGRNGLVINTERALRTMEVPLTHYDRCWELLQQFPGAFIYDLLKDESWNNFISTVVDNPYYSEQKGRIICSSTLFPNQSICHGDSGGPLMIQRSDGRYELTGINRGGTSEDSDTFIQIVEEKTGQENAELSNYLYNQYKLKYPCGHQPEFINTHHFIGWIRDTIIQDQQQSGQTDYTEYFVYTLASVTFIGTSGTAIREQFRNRRAARQQQQQPPLTPSGVVQV